VPEYNSIQGIAVQGSSEPYLILVQDEVRFRTPYRCAPYRAFALVRGALLWYGGSGRVFLQINFILL